MLNIENSELDENLILANLDRTFMRRVVDLLHPTSYNLRFETIGSCRYVNAQPVQNLWGDIGGVTITEDNIDLLIATRDELKAINKFAVNSYLLELFIRSVKNIPLSEVSSRTIQRNENIPAEKFAELIALFPSG